MAQSFYAGWYATLATMLFENDFDIDCIRSFDIDESCVEIAEVFNGFGLLIIGNSKQLQKILKILITLTSQWQMWSNKNNRLQSLVILLIQLLIQVANILIILQNGMIKYPMAKLVILQSNNYFEIEEHVNCPK